MLPDPKLGFNAHISGAHATLAAKYLRTMTTAKKTAIQD